MADDIMFYSFPLKSDPTQSASFRIEDLYRLSFDQCVYFLLETETPTNIRHAIAYQLGTITFYDSELHKNAKFVVRRTPAHKRFYKKDICKCDTDECIYALRITHAYVDAILNDPQLFASYNKGMINFCFGELPRAHSSFRNFLGIADKR